MAQQAAYEEFVALFADSPELVETVSPEILPFSFRLYFVTPGHAAFERVEAAAQDARGVRELVSDDQFRSQYC